MEKTLTIGEKEVRLSNNISWMIVYKDQFGRDIVPTLMPMLAGVVDVISNVLKSTGKSSDITMEDILEALDSDTISDLAIHLSMMEMTDLINITWSMAKVCDDSIPEPKRWLKDMDTFPLDEVVPEVFNLIMAGVVSSKNLKRLEEIKTALQPNRK